MGIRKLRRLEGLSRHDGIVKDEPDQDSLKGQGITRDKVSQARCNYYGYGTIQAMLEPVTVYFLPPITHTQALGRVSRGGVAKYHCAVSTSSQRASPGRYGVQYA
jgi:hypothetical protein